MTTSGAEKLVALSAMTTIGAVSLSSMTKGQMPAIRSLIGAGVTFTVLSAVAEPAPSLAGALAGTIMFTAIVHYGIPLMDSYFTHTGSGMNTRKTK